MFPWLNSSFQNSPQYHLCRRFLPPSLPGAQPGPSKCRRYTVLITVTLLKCAWYIGRIRDCMKRLRLFSINVQPTWNSRALNLSHSLQSGKLVHLLPSIWIYKIEGDGWCVMLYSHQMEQKTLSTLNVNTPFHFFYGVLERCRDWCIIFSSVILFLWLTVFA